jgi:general secretion pathway protein F
MPLYRYKAIAGTGAILTGTDEAANAPALARQLRAQGHFPVSADPVAAASMVDRLRDLLQGGREPSRRALAMMTQEFAALLDAGLELDRALGMIAELEDIASLRPVLTAVRQRVRDGASLSDALAGERGFPPYYVSMVRAGEAGGMQSVTLARLADYMNRSLAIRETIGSALVYPMVLLATAGLSVLVILTLVLPEFEPLFESSGHALPWPTRLLMELSSVVREFWWLLILLAIGAFAVAHAALRRPTMRARRDAWLLRLPLVGELLRSMELERLYRTLGALARNGVPLPTALKLSGEVLWNSVLREAINEAAASLRDGDVLSARLARTLVFPARTLDLIRIGEETGKLDEMLLRQADLDEQRIRHTLDRLLTLLVPALTILLGFVVAGLIASMLVAILSVNDLALQ